LTAFSQQDTAKLNKDTSYIKMPKPMAVAVAKDLIRYDSSIMELNYSNQTAYFLSQNLAYKDSIIASKDSLYNHQKELNQTNFNLLSLKDQQIDLYKKDNDKLRKIAIKKDNTKNFFMGSTILLIIFEGLRIFVSK
jgi:hypothetical protein